MQRSKKHLFADEFLSSSPDILISCQIKNGWPVEYISENILQFGYESDELINNVSHFQDMIHPEDRARVYHEFNDHNQKGYNSFRQQYRIVSKNGTLHQVEEQKVIKRDAENNALYYIGFITDITDRRKQEEESLNKERLFLQNIIDGIADPILVIDTDYNVIISNQAQLNAQIDDSSAIESRKCYNIAHGRDTVCDQSEFPCSLQQVLKTQQTISFIHQHHFKNEARTYELFASPLHDEHGNINAIIEINHDITDSVKTHLALEEKEIKLKQLIQSRAEMVDLITRLVVDFIAAKKENLDELIDNGLSLIGQLTHVDRCCLFSFDSTMSTTSNTHEWCRKQEHSRKNILQNISTKPYKCFYKRLKSGKPIYIPDVEQLESCLEPLKVEFQKQDIKSVLIVPMHTNGKLDGILGFVSVESLKYWSDEDVNLLLLLGKIITATKVRIETEMHLHHSQTVMKSILDTMDAMVYVCDQKNHELLFVNKQVQEMIGSNVKTVCMEVNNTDNDFKSGLCDFCTNNAADHSEQSGSDFQVWDFQSKMNQRWYHCRAKNFLWIDGRQVRLVVTTDISERVNSEQTNQKLFDENSKLIHEMLKSTENERKYLARELHDEMGQLITAIRLEADFLQQECKSYSDDIVSSISEIKSISSDVLNSIRNVTNRLRPSAMTQNSIVDTLKELHYNWKKHNHNISSSFQVSGEIPAVSDSISIVLYRVLQECLTNIARHASDSKQVTISLHSGLVDGSADNMSNKQSNYSMLTLIVEDAGSGFDVNASHIGIGISGMRERLQGINGQFQISSEAEVGTKMVAIIPLPPEEEK